MERLPEGIYRLEYNEKQRCFHYDQGQHAEGSFGWIKLKIMSNDECNEFCDFMDKKYVNGRVTGILPELSVVKLELNLFAELKKHRRKLAGRV